MKRFKLRSIGEEDVKLAVVVEVEDSYASGHGFWRVALRRLVAVQPEINRLKDEADGAVAGGGWALRRSFICALGTQGQVESQDQHEEYGQWAGKLPHLLHVADGGHKAGFILLRQLLLPANGKAKGAASVGNFQKIRERLRPYNCF